MSFWVGASLVLAAAVSQAPPKKFNTIKVIRSDCALWSDVPDRFGVECRNGATEEDRQMLALCRLAPADPAAKRGIAAVAADLASTVHQERGLRALAYMNAESCTVDPSLVEPLMLPLRRVVERTARCDGYGGPQFLFHAVRALGPAMAPLGTQVLELSRRDRCESDALLLLADLAPATPGLVETLQQGLEAASPSRFPSFEVQVALRMGPNAEPLVPDLIALMQLAVDQVASHERERISSPEYDAGDVARALAAIGGSEVAGSMPVFRSALEKIAAGRWWDGQAFDLLTQLGKLGTSMAALEPDVRKVTTSAACSKEMKAKAADTLAALTR